MPPAPIAPDDVARTTHTSQPLARMGFVIAAVGAVLLLVWPFVPQWQPQKVWPPLALEILKEITYELGPHSTPSSFNVDSGPRFSMIGLVMVCLIYIGLLIGLAAGQAFRRRLSERAGRLAGIGLSLGLLLFLPYLYALLSLVFAPGVTFTNQNGELVTHHLPVPYWSALADSYLLWVFVALLLVVLGYGIAVSGDRRHRASGSFD